MHIKKKIGYFLVFLTTMLLYNNCGKSPFEASSQSSSSTLPADSSSATTIEPPVVIPPVVTPPILGDSGDTTESDYSVKKIPVFFAIGHQGSRMYSCDGGRSWEGYREYDPSLYPRCTVEGSSCDHNEAAAQQIAWGEGGFIFNYGHGVPGSLIRTYNGRQYDQLLTDASFAGVAYGNSTYMLALLRNPLLSVDKGKTWVSGNNGKIPTIAKNSRAGYFINHNTGVFFIMNGTQGVVDVVRSIDNGISFQFPSTLPSTCGNGTIAYYKGITLMTGADLCLSFDGGDNWQVVSGAPFMSDRLLTVKNGFHMYSEGTVAYSADGKNWIEQPLKLNGVPTSLQIRSVTYHKDLDTFVAIYQVSNNWYEKTRYFYSDDGIDWKEVDKSAGLAPLAPHPIKDIAAGYFTRCGSKPN